jgi:outer membrane protein W
MKAVLTTVALLAVTSLAQAQTASAPVSQADVTGTLGWLSADKSELNTARYGNDWYNRSVYVGAGFGWYWTDHWKTELEAGISSSADLNVYRSEVIDRRTTTINSTYEFVTRRLTLGQQYQFFRNAWFHPFAGAGLDLTWEQIDRTDEVNAVYAPQPPSGRVPHPRRTEFVARPFTAFGFKAYVNPRTFFRTDLKVVFDKGVDETLVRFGLGVDF